MIILLSLQFNINKTIFSKKKVKYLTYEVKTCFICKLNFFLYVFSICQILYIYQKSYLFIMSWYLNLNIFFSSKKHEETLKDGLIEVDIIRQDNLAYEYLCHLEETKV